MTESEFWEIIAASKKGAKGTIDEQYNHRLTELRRILSGLDLNEIVSFETIFSQLANKAYDWGLWGAAYLLNGGCSDDGFQYFRWTLICEGQERFENALRDPDSIADWAEPDLECEDFGYIAFFVYREKSGNDSMPLKRVFPDKPSGEDWEEDELANRFPKIAAKVE